MRGFRLEQLAGSNLYRVWVKRSESSAEVLLPDVGFGVSQVLPVLTLCYSVPEGSTILLEQPEIHLHPSVQSGLADLFIDAVRSRRIQIIVESHSEHLLKRLQRRVAEEYRVQGFSEPLLPEEVALYFCKAPNGESQLEPLVLDAYGRISNWPQGFFGDDFAEMEAVSEAVIRRKRAAA